MATLLVPLTTLLPPHAPRPTLHASGSTLHAQPAGSGRAQTRPRWLLPVTDRRIDKDRTGPDHDEQPVHTQYVTEIQYVTEPGSFFGLIHPFLPARRRPIVDHSRAAGGAQRHGL
jgi:hypothetical protein